MAAAWPAWVRGSDPSAYLIPFKGFRPCSYPMRERRDPEDDLGGDNLKVLFS